MFSPLIDDLIKTLKRLPGVGPKSAQRMAFHLLEHDRIGASKISKALAAAVERVKRCRLCRNLTEQDVCQLCANPKRDGHLMCVVETPADVIALEQSATYTGKYFVLLGRLSPLDGVGPKEIGLDVLEQRLMEEDIKELIIATNPTVEGEATSHYITERARKHNVVVTRIAHGVPLGGELEYIDGGTLAHAMASRKEVE